jgi:hypothetical protein
MKEDRRCSSGDWEKFRSGLGAYFVLEGDGLRDEDGKRESLPYSLFSYHTKCYSFFPSGLSYSRA